MPKVVSDASTLVGALLNEDSVPERARLLARLGPRICLSQQVQDEIREVFGRPKFRKYLAPDRGAKILDVLTIGALRAYPTEAVHDCRDMKDDKYLELALAVAANVIVSSDEDLLCLHPWRGIDIVKPSALVARMGMTGPAFAAGEKAK
jgi:putative PIN family toxin of toxin-antitoxin system